MPSHGIANETRALSTGIVTAASQPAGRSRTRCTPLLNVTDVPAPGSSSRRTWSTHGPGRVHESASVHGDDRVADAIGNLHAAAADRDDLRVVQHHRTAIGRGPHVGETQASVVRLRVDVQPRGLHPLEPQRRDESGGLARRDDAAADPLALPARDRATAPSGSPSSRTARRRRPGARTAVGERGAAPPCRAAPALRRVPRGRGGSRPSAGSAARHGSASTTRSTLRTRSRRGRPEPPPGRSPPPAPRLPRRRCRRRSRAGRTARPSAARAPGPSTTPPAPSHDGNERGRPRPPSLGTQV